MVINKLNEAFNLNKSLNKALNGGMAGSAAMATQVLSLMWLRTTMNYQYKNGGNMVNTLGLLYKEGGVKRLYRGYPFALMQGPLARFGDTAMNKLSNEVLKDQNVMVRTGGGTLCASLWRIFIMPIDTFKSNYLITDWSGIAIEYFLITKKPVIFVDTKAKIRNKNFDENNDNIPLEVSIRNKIGLIIKPLELSNINFYLEEIDKKNYKNEIELIEKKILFSNQINENNFNQILN